MSQAGRQATRGRLFNLVVTTCPVPSIRSTCVGREIVDFFPTVPLARGQRLGVAVLSYNGRLGFGLGGDWDAVPDLDDLAEDLRTAIDELADAAGVEEAQAGAGA